MPTMCRARPGPRRTAQLLDFTGRSACIPVLPVSTAIEACRARLIVTPAESHHRLSGRGIFLLSTLTSPRVARLRQGPSPSGKQENSPAANSMPISIRVRTKIPTVSFGAFRPSPSQKRIPAEKKAKRNHTLGKPNVEIRREEWF